MSGTMALKTRVQRAITRLPLSVLTMVLKGLYLRRKRNGDDFPNEEDHDRAVRAYGAPDFLR
jgi:hypothetical protein